MSKYRRLIASYRALRKATTLDLWSRAAQEIDALEGFTRWREKDESGYYPYQLLQEQMERLQEYREYDRVDLLVPYLQESLHRTLGELTDPHLYNMSLVGTKYLVERYLDEVECSLDYLCDEELSGFSSAEKVTLFKDARDNFGRTALMLSGGGAFGIYHLGIVKALVEKGLLPSVISGTSMGAIVAGLVGTHSDEALLDLLSMPESNDFSPIKKHSLKDIFSEGILLDSEQLFQCISNNIPPVTFMEAYQATGRAISITVSPTRAGQKARILNYKTAPNALVVYACQASCSIPGLFVPVQLKAKNSSGEIVPYMETELWADGGVNNDIPMSRIGRLFNVNHFIVSQANPHVLPFIANQVKPGVVPALIDFATGSVNAQVNQAIVVGKKRTQNRRIRFWMERMNAVLGQEYQGDINMHPDYPLRKYLRILANPSDREIYGFILTGERATWPKLAMIDNQTRISRVLARCYQKCFEKHEKSKEQPEGGASIQPSAGVASKNASSSMQSRQASKNDALAVTQDKAVNNEASMPLEA